jgi:DNA-binding FadR family transcriptional regulator
MVADSAPSNPEAATPGAPALAPPARGSAAIAARLRQAILDGAYARGDRLPAERELARLLAASRTTVRAALERLAEGGLVSRRVGSGTFVTYGSDGGEGDVAEITSPLELIEVRQGVEPHITRLAVVNASARDLARLVAALEGLEAAGGDAEAFSHWDERFHLALAECTHNPLLVSMYRQINHVRGHAQWSARKDKILTPKRIARYNRQHRALTVAIQSRDVEGALRLIAEHLEQARRDLLGVEG